MKIEVKRKLGNDGFTEGKLFVDGVFECYTVEDEVRTNGEKIYGKTAIPAGTYNVTITYSNHFKRFLPLIQGVPNFEGVRIHSGNSSSDTEGCIIVGSINSNMDDDYVGASRVAFDRLHSKIKTALSNKKKVTLTIG